jgi:Lysylphosphatidylglycerol synthase TM region
MRLNKNLKIFINYFLGPLLFAWLVFSIYHQVQRQPHLEDSWRQIKASFQSSKIIYLFLALLLIPCNWGLEALKWQLSVRKIFPIRFVEAFKAVLSGVSFSITMPNRIGEYLGRMMYLPEGTRLRTISVTLVGSLAQMLATLFFGTIGLIYLKKDLLQHFEGFRIWYQFIFYGLITVLLISILVYFNVSVMVNWIRKWLKMEKYAYLVEALQFFKTGTLLKLLAFSFLRYLVFILQYVLIFRLFEVNVSPVMIMMVVSILFLALAIIPSVTLIEIGLRWDISLKLMGMYSDNGLGISFTSNTIWFINLILPAIIGSILLLNLRVFKKRNGGR